MKIIAGVDEVGRGPLAGPVVATSVILKEKHGIEGLRDSKKLSKRQRNKIYPIIKDQALGIGIGIVDEKIIDKINIREATFMAMEISLKKLPMVPDFALIDGECLKNQKIPNKGIIKGDSLIDSIKAASIIAKVTRDKIMEDYSIIFPEYGFDKNSGYGTKMHMEALKEFRACSIHRKTFKPVLQNMPSMTWYEKNKMLDLVGIRYFSLFLYKEKFEILKTKNIKDLNSFDIITKKSDIFYFFFIQSFYDKDKMTFNNEISKKKSIKFKSELNRYLIQNPQIVKYKCDFVKVLVSKNISHTIYFRINES